MIGQKRLWTWSVGKLAAFPWWHFFSVANASRPVMVTKLRGVEAQCERLTWYSYRRTWETSQGLSSPVVFMCQMWGLKGCLRNCRGEMRTLQILPKSVDDLEAPWKMFGEVGASTFPKSNLWGQIGQKADAFLCLVPRVKLLFCAHCSCFVSYILRLSFEWQDFMVNMFCRK